MLTLESPLGILVAVIIFAAFVVLVLWIAWLREKLNTERSASTSLLEQMSSLYSELNRQDNFIQSTLNHVFRGGVAVQLIQGESDLAITTISPGDRRTKPDHYEVLSGVQGGPGEWKFYVINQAQAGMQSAKPLDEVSIHLKPGNLVYVSSNGSHDKLPSPPHYFELVVSEEHARGKISISVYRPRISTDIQIVEAS